MWDKKIKQSYKFTLQNFIWLFCLIVPNSEDCKGEKTQTLFYLASKSQPECWCGLVLWVFLVLITCTRACWAVLTITHFWYFIYYNRDISCYSHSFGLFSAIPSSVYKLEGHLPSYAKPQFHNAFLTPSDKMPLTWLDGYASIVFLHLHIHYGSAISLLILTTTSI